MDQLNADSHSWPLLLLLNALYILRVSSFHHMVLSPAFSRSNSMEDHVLWSSEPLGKVSTEVLGSIVPTLSPTLASPLEIHLSSAVRKWEGSRGHGPLHSTWLILFKTFFFKKPRHFNITKLWIILKALMVGTNL